MNYFTKDPEQIKAMLEERYKHRLAEMLEDPIWLAMTSVLGIHRDDVCFKEIVRCFWTTLCIINGVDYYDRVYSELLNRLCAIYRTIGVELDPVFMDMYVNTDLEPPEDLWDD